MSDMVMDIHATPCRNLSDFDFDSMTQPSAGAFVSLLFHNQSVCDVRFRGPFILGQLVQFHRSTGLHVA